MLPPTANKATHFGFGTQRSRSPKHGVSVTPKKGLMSSKKKVQQNLSFVRTSGSFDWVLQWWFMRKYIWKYALFLMTTFFATHAFCNNPDCLEAQCDYIDL